MAQHGIYGGEKEMTKRINITPMLTEKDVELISKGLYILSARNYDLTDNENIFQDIPLAQKAYLDLREDTSLSTDLRNRLEKLYREKVKRSRGREQT